MVSEKIRALAATALVAAAVIVGGAPFAQAATTTEVVRESNVVRQLHGTPPTNDWVIYNRDTGAAAFVNGPATPPLGAGSLQLSTTTSNDKVYAFNYDHTGTPLSSIDAISYSTYRTAGSLQQVTALNIEVDVNGPAAGGYTVLVFEPVYNTSQGAVVNDTWQTWDAYSGGNATWWSSRAIPGVCAFSCFVSWSTILAANPDAVIVGGFGVNQGGGNPGLTAAVDALTLGYGGNTTVYDFEPPLVVATTKAQCMNGGWMSVYRADGSAFSNQGDCIQYVNTGR